MDTERDREKVRMKEGVMNMKEKGWIRGLFKKVVSFFLVLCIFLNSLPAGRVLADGGQEEVSGNAFEALGIDNKKTPEGYQQHARNPYGKDVVSSNPVQELYIAGLGDAVGEEDILAPSAGQDVEDNASVLRALEEKYNDYLQKNIFQAVKGSSAFPDKYSYTLYGDGICKDNGEALQSGKKQELPYEAKMENIYVRFKKLQESQLDRSYLKDRHRQVGKKQTAISAMAAGTFDNSRIDTKKEHEKHAFRKSQVAIVYTSELDKNGGLYLKIRDVLTGRESEPIELMSTEEIIGNPDLKNDRDLPYENFQSDPYLLQNYLKVTTGDYDGDGVDEIAVYVPKKGDSKIAVYKLGRASGDGDEAFLDAGKWKRDWTYSLHETSYTSNMVSLTSGDFNRDGIDDLAGAWGYYYGPQENRGSTAVVMFGDTSRCLQQSRQFDLKYQGGDLVRGAFIYGDFFSKGKNMLIFGGQSDADLKAGNPYTRYVCAYVWDGNHFVAKTQKNFDLFAKNGNGDLLYPAMQGVRKLLSMPLMPVNMAVVAQGLPKPDKKSPSTLYLDSLLIGGLEDGFTIQKRLDREGYGSYEIGEEFVEYQAVSGDLTGDGESAVAVVRQKLIQTAIQRVGVIVHSSGFDKEPKWKEQRYYKDWFHKLIKEPSNRMVHDGDVDSGPVFKSKQPVNFFERMPKVDVWVLDRTGSPVQKWENQDISTTLCMTNTDDDTSFMKYTGKHFFTYSDPKVLAVLASPPYFQDLRREDLSGSYGESETSYGSSSGSGSSQTKSTSIRAGAYFGFEHEAQAFGIPIATVEFETEIGVEMTMESEQTQMQEQTITYGTVAGSDTVVLYAMPIEVYEFEAYRPNERGEYQNFKMVRNIPHPAAIRTMELDRYQDIQKDFAGVLPDISDKVLTHELGKPETYPKELPTVGGSIGKVIAYKGTPVGVGFSESGAFITQEIAMSEENKECFELSQNYDFKIGGGLSGFKAGVTVGLSSAKGSATITTSGSSFSGTMRAMPIEAENYGYGHLWKIFSYQYDEGGMSFPVVNYMVSDVAQPAPLPTDFAQDVDRTTDKTAVLTWTYDKPVAGFQLYSYNQYPDGSGLDELAYVPFSDGTKNGDKYEFEYAVENLSPYSDYQFKIQTVQTALPSKSIPSEVLSVRTKTQNGYPTIRMRNKTEGEEIADGKIRLYPDAGLEVEVLVENKEIYKRINYQWQKKDVSGKWKDLPGKTDAVYPFKTANYGDRGTYRCRVNLKYFDSTAQKEFYISAYSKELLADYLKRPMTLASEGIFAQAASKDIVAQVHLCSASKNHYVAPTGEVEFRLRGAQGSETRRVSLTKTSTPENGKDVASGQTSFKNLADGVYEVTVSYLGDHIFATKNLEEKKFVVVGNAVGKIAALKSGEHKKDRFTYGDEIRAEVYEVRNDSETLSNESYTYTLRQYRDYEEWRAKKVQGAAYSREASASGSVWKFEPSGTPDQRMGFYRLDVTKDGWENQLFFTIDPKDIQIKADDKKATTGNISSTPATYSLSEGALVEGDSFEAAMVTYKFYDTAGKEVSNFGENTDPGNYRIEPLLNPNYTDSNNYHRKYKFSFKSGVYTVLGSTYPIELEAQRIGHLIAGVVSAEEFTGMKGEVIAGTTLHLTAAPYTGYEVAEWNVYENGGTEAVHHQEGGNTFTHAMKSAKTKVVVRFKKVGYVIKVFQPFKGGEIKNDEGISFSKTGTSVTKGAKFHFRAEPSAGYSFKRWNITPNTTDVITKMDGNEAEITVSKPTIQIRAEFAREQYTLNLGEHIGAYYMFDEDDDVSTPKVRKELQTGDKISKDEDVFCYLTPGYEVADGEKWKIDDAEQDDATLVNGELKIAADSVEGDAVTVTVRARAKRLKISTKVVHGDTGEENGDLGKISVTVNGVPVENPEELENVEGSGKVVFEAKATHGYRFVQWKMNGEEISGSGSTCTVERLVKDIEMIAVMEKEETKTVTVTVEPSDRAEPRYTLFDRYGAEVEERDFSSGEAITVYKGDRLKVHLNLKPYTIVEQWQVGGVPKPEVEPEYTFSNITEDMEVAAYLTATVEHRITIQTSGVESGESLKAVVGGETVYEGNDPKTITVWGGEKIVFTAEGLAADRCITEWKVNGEKVDLSENGNPEFFVNKDATIVVVFGELKEFDLKLPQEYNEMAEIDVKAVPESGHPGKVREGAKLTFKITPKEGYLIRGEDILLEGGTFDSLTEENGTWIAVIDAVSQEINLALNAKKRVKIGMKQENVTVWLDENSDTLSYAGGTVRFGIEGKTMAQGVEGDVVGLTVTPHAEYDLKDIRAYKPEEEDRDLLVPNGDGYQFTAPAGEVIVEANFKQKEPTTYPITVIGGTASPTKAAEGATVRITAEVPSGQRFKEWRVDSGNITLANPTSESTTFEMPNSAVEITAAYESVVPPTPPTPTTYPITVIGGTANRTRASKGTTVRITADVPNGKRFKEWRIDSGNITLANPTSESTSFKMPNSAVRITAMFESVVPPTPEEKVDLEEIRKNAHILPEKTTDDPKKEWTVTLNMDLATVNLEKIRLLDEKGVVLKATVRFDLSNPRQIRIIPEKEYVSGKRYYVYIQKEGLVSQTGKKLKKDVLFSFVFRR